MEILKHSDRICMKELTNAVALIVEDPLKGSGAAHRNSPTGGLAYGIPRYSETPSVPLEIWPLTIPLLVLTVFGPDVAVQPGTMSRDNSPTGTRLINILIYSKTTKILTVRLASACSRSPIATIHPFRDCLPYTLNTSLPAWSSQHGNSPYISDDIEHVGTCTGLR